MGAVKAQLIDWMEHPETSPAYQAALSGLLQEVDMLLYEFQETGKITATTQLNVSKARIAFYNQTGE